MKITEPDDREAKLPVWAQDRMELMRRRIRELKANIQSLSAGKGDLELRSFSDDPLVFDEDYVRFWLDRKRLKYFGIRLITPGGKSSRGVQTPTLDITGMEPLVVLPQVSNNVHIETRTR